MANKTKSTRDRNAVRKHVVFGVTSRDSRHGLFAIFEVSFSVRPRLSQQSSNVQVAAVMPPSLQAAVASGDVALATTLVDASLTSNGGAHASRNMAVMDRAGDMMGRTALHIASESGHGVMVEWLLTQCQAEANARDSQGARPLHYAAEGNKVDAIDVLLRNGAKVSMAVRALPSSFQIKSFQVGTLD